MVWLFNRMVLTRNCPRIIALLVFLLMISKLMLRNNSDRLKSSKSCFLCNNKHVIEFFTNQKNIIKKHEPQKYVYVLRPKDVGYANVVNAVLSGLMVALLTNSAFIGKY